MKYHRKWTQAITLKEGRTTLKILRVFIFRSKLLFLFIAVSHARGTDHGVGLNSTPTVIKCIDKTNQRRDTYLSWKHKLSNEDEEEDIVEIE